MRTRNTKFTVTAPGTYRTSLKPPARLDTFPYLASRPEWKLVPWAAALQESPEHHTFIGACDYKGVTQFYFQQWGNPEVVVVVVKL